MSVKVPPISTPIRTPGDAVVIGGLSCQRRSRAALWLLRLGRRPVSSCRPPLLAAAPLSRSEEHTSELQSLMRISYAVFCLKKKTKLLSQQCVMHDKPNTQTMILNLFKSIIQVYNQAST